LKVGGYALKRRYRRLIMFFVLRITSTILPDISFFRGRYLSLEVMQIPAYHASATLLNKVLNKF